MWGTTSTSAQLTGNFAGAPEDTSIGDRRLVRLLAGKLVAQRFGTFATVSEGKADVSLREQIGQVIRIRAAKFINLARERECAYPECLDLLCVGMLLFKLLDLLVE